MPQLKAFARELKLVGYSRLRKVELIAFIKKELRPKKPGKKLVSKRSIPDELANESLNNSLTK